MYDFLRGQVISKSATRLVLEVGGIGFELECPLSSLERFRVGQTAKVLCHLHVREDLMKLHGFALEEERELFRLLQKVSGVGPGLALQILSRAGVREIAQAIAEGRADVLKSLKGVGPKTAQRLVTELSDKVGAFVGGALPAGPAATLSALEEDASQALEVLGCPAKQARAAVQKVVAEEPEIEVDALVRRALKLVWP